MDYRSDSLLKTKILIPVLPRSFIPRKRLFAQLNAGLERRVILLSAPAGCGKTSLICDWIRFRSSTPAFGWVSLDISDNDPNLFLQYVIAALKVVNPHIGESILPALQSPYPPHPIQIIPSIINQIQQRNEKIVLVLDDYHLITNSTVHEITIQLIERGCAGLKIVIATRADPPIPIHRYRAQGELMELRQAHLNFTLEEASIFLQQDLAGKLETDEIATLHHRTEGWVVGLLLASLSLQESEDIPRSVAALSGNQTYIMEYLTNEVLERQSEKVKNFLVKTSILERLTGSLCDHLTGFDDGYATLENLKTRNLFVSAIDHQQTWYRYHHLFADLLQKRLERDYPGKITQLHKSASDWYGQNGFLIAAIEHGIESRDYSHVTEMTEQFSERIWGAGQQNQLIRLLGRIPSEIVHSHVSLCLWYSVVIFFAGQYDHAGKLLQIAETLVQEKRFESDRSRQEVLGVQALQAAQLALYELDTFRAIELANRSLEHLPIEMQLLRQIAQIILADALNFGGDTRAGQQAYTRLLGLEAIQGTFLYYSIAIRCLANGYARGKLHQVHAFGLQLLEQLDGMQPKFPALFDAVFHISVGEVLVEWNQLADACSHFDRACQIFEINVGETAEAFFLRMVRGYAAFGQRERAHRIVDLVEAAVRLGRLPGPNLGSVLAAKAGLSLEEGFIQQAEDILTELGSVDCEALVYQNEAAYLMLARIWLSKGNVQPAVELLAALQTRFREGGRTSRLIEALILGAMAEAQQDRWPVAQDNLRHALELAEPEGFVSLFVAGGEVIRNILDAICQQGDGSAYACRLLDTFREPLSSTGASCLLVEPLSSRETQVLRLLRTHLSQQEIADELCVSVNTIRFHTKNIYSKLDVHDRSSAVDKAVKHGMI